MAPGAPPRAPRPPWSQGAFLDLLWEAKATNEVLETSGVPASTSPGQPAGPRAAGLWGASWPGAGPASACDCGSGRLGELPLGSGNRAGRGQLAAGGGEDGNASGTHGRPPRLPSQKKTFWRLPCLSRTTRDPGSRPGRGDAGAAGAPRGEDAGPGTVCTGPCWAWEQGSSQPPPRAAGTGHSETEGQRGGGSRKGPEVAGVGDRWAGAENGQGLRRARAKARSPAVGVSGPCSHSAPWACERVCVSVHGLWPCAGGAGVAGRPRACGQGWGQGWGLLSLQSPKVRTS